MAFRPRASLRAGFVLVLFAVTALLVGASAATASTGDIFASHTSNTQIRAAVDQTASTPDFTGQAWQTPVSGYHSAYSILSGADWLGETNDAFGHTINQHWEQYRAVFDLPSGSNSAGIELLVDNEVTAMTINGVQFGCGYDQTCNYFNGERFAINIPSDALQATGNELLITVLDYETAPATGGLTFKVVAPGIAVNTAAPDVSGVVGQSLNASGSFRQVIDADASGHPITITADNAFGTFTDNGDGTWSWTGTGAAPSNGTITVTATDDRGITATDSFDYIVSGAPTIALSGVSCLTITNGFVDPFQVTIGDAPSGFFYVFTEASPDVPDSLVTMYQYGYENGPGVVLVDVNYQYQQVAGTPSTLWLTVRGSDYPTDLRASLEVPVCGSDTTPPTTTDDAPAGWQSGDVTVNLTASDGDGSGVASTHYSVDGGSDQVGTSVSIPAPADHSNDGTHSITYYSIDNNGNTETAHSTTVNIDTTGPTVTYSGNTGTYSIDQSVSISCSASDALSGVASSTCADVTGPAWSFGVGSHSYSASATDNAGNTGTGSTSFTVTVDSQSLCALVRQFSTSTDVADGLCAKLTAASAAAARGQTKAQANILSAFDNQVAAQTGKALTVEQAQLLTQLAGTL